MDYLVMEHIEGETLSKRLEKGPLPLEQVLKYGAQVADGLDKAHRGGVVHRDLKPGNIMLTSPKVGQRIIVKILGQKEPVEALVRAVIESADGIKLIVNFGHEQVATVSLRDVVGTK